MGSYQTQQVEVLLGSGCGVSSVVVHAVVATAAVEAAAVALLKLQQFASKFGFQTWFRN